MKPWQKNIQEILDIDVDGETYHYDYSNYLAEHHRDKLEEIMKIVIEAHDRIGLILLPLVEMKNEQKKKVSFEIRRAKFAQNDIFYRRRINMSDKHLTDEDKLTDAEKEQLVREVQEWMHKELKKTQKKIERAEKSV